MRGLVITVIAGTYFFAHATSLDDTDQAITAFNMSASLHLGELAHNQLGRLQPYGSAVNVSTNVSTYASGERLFDHIDQTNEERLELPWHSMPSWIIECGMRIWLRFKTSPSVAFERLGLAERRIKPRIFAFWMKYFAWYERLDSTFDYPMAADMLVRSGGNIDEVVAILMSFFQDGRIKEKAKLLHNALAKRLEAATDDVMQNAWQRSKSSPRVVFQILGLDRANALTEKQGSVIQWLKYTEMLSRLDDPLKMSDEHVAQMLIAKGKPSPQGIPELISAVDQLARLRYLVGPLQTASYTRTKTYADHIEAAQRILERFQETGQLRG
ncbi:unnamed protein product [Hyaloperonospora brassicae]|uniref:RXLR phytopathogen effector protein WY-domain domain-containing protein n=1 Tax=Hyaloperonospora brassicae TaxID=162125 RepID=A0AAV0TZP5_HYABA|nr:unnamed protein product [Hyaloperonospora brassicae]